MNEAKKLQILLVRPGEEPKIVEIADELSEMQRLVGGFIQEIMPFDEEVALVCNEEGKFRELPLNRAIRDEEGEIMDIIAGDFFLCSAPIMSENFESLSKEQMEKYQEMFKSPEQFIQKSDGIGVRPIRKNNREIER